MNCILCIENITGTNRNFFEVFSMEGLCMNIYEIISKHSLLEENYEIVDGSVICADCWDALNAFHIFYEKVKKAQKQLELQELDTKYFPSDTSAFDDDPLSCDTEIKRDHIENTEELLPKVAEIEVQELNLLPKIEISSNAHNISARTRRALKRNQSTEQNEYINVAQKLGIEKKPKRVTKTKLKRRTKKKPKTIIKKQANKAADTTIVEATTATAVDNSATAAEPEIDNSPPNALADEDNNISNAESEDEYVPYNIKKRLAKLKKSMQPKPINVHSQRVMASNTRQKEYDKIIKKFFFEKLLCSICNFSLKNFYELRRHFFLSHNIKPGYLICCNYKFYERRTLVEHIDVHLKPELYKFHCTKCIKAFQDEESYKQHFQVHEKVAKNYTKYKNRYKCDKCGKLCSHKQELDRHRSAKHIPKSQYKFTCELCNKKLPSVYHLKNHIKTAHDPGKKRICDKCGKYFCSQSSLDKHNKSMHSDAPITTPVPVQCETCGSWLSSAFNLQRHIKFIHEAVLGEFPCHICNKISTTERGLKRHIYLHHSCADKFKCTLCDKKFKRKQDLREHTSTHTGEVLYRCSSCPMTFFSNANMYTHRRRRHRAEWEAGRRKKMPPNVNGQTNGDVNGQIIDVKNMKVEADVVELMTAINVLQEN